VASAENNHLAPYRLTALDNLWWYYLPFSLSRMNVSLDYGRIVRP
jgi:hypothetical protein